MIIFDLNGVDKIKLNKETDELEILKPDGSSEKTKNSEGLNELLFKEKIDFSKVTEKDVDDYFNIFILLQYDPGQSKRVKEIREKFSNISNQFPARRFKSWFYMALESPSVRISRFRIKHSSSRFN